MKYIITVLLALASLASFAQCDPPSSLVVSNLTYTSGRVTFTPPVQPVSTYSWAIFTYPGDVFTGVQGTGPSTVVNFTGLAANTTYRFKVATICVSTGTSIAATVNFTTISSGLVYTPMTAAGYQYKYIKIDSGALFLPGDTTIGRAPNVGGQIKYKSSDSIFYFYNGLRWKPLAIDSFGIVAQLNNKVDSVTLVSNTLYYWKVGVGYGVVLPIANDSAYVSAQSINDSTIRLYRVNRDSTTLTIRGTAAGGGGSTNTSVGSGYKIAINGTNNIKSLFGKYGIILDSVTTGQIGVLIDTANKITSRLQAQHLIDSLGAVKQQAISLAAIGSSPNNNGATLSSGTFTLQPADATHGGVLKNADQDIPNVKRFQSDVYAGGKLVTGATSGILGDQFEIATGNMYINGGNIGGFGGLYGNDQRPYSYILPPLQGSYGWLHYTPNSTLTGATLRLKVGDGTLHPIQNSTFTNSNLIIEDTLKLPNAIYKAVDTPNLHPLVMDNNGNVFKSNFTGSGGSGVSGIGNYNDSIANVLNYGAVGDGVTVDSTAFKNAIATGKNVYAPKGAYLLPGTLYITKKGQKIFGDGAASILKTTTLGSDAGYYTQYHMIELTDSNQIVEGLHFEGTGQGTLNPTYTTQNGVNVWGGNCTVRNCYFYNLNGVGISRIHYDGSSFGLHTRFGLTAYGNIVNYCGGGYYNYLTGYDNIYGNNFSKNDVSIWGDGSNCYFADNRCDSSNYGFRTTVGDRGTITGSTFNHCLLDGIYITNTTNGFTFSNCTFFFTSRYLYNADRTIFNNCQNADNGTITVGGSGTTQTVSFIGGFSANSNTYVETGTGKIIRVGVQDAGATAYNMLSEVSVRDTFGIGKARISASSDSAYTKDPITSKVSYAKINGGGSGWGLTGNSGTTSGTNYLGTSDNKSLNFRTNNLQALKIDSLQNVQIGYFGNNMGTGAGNLSIGTSQNFTGNISLGIGNGNNLYSSWSAAVGGNNTNYGAGSFTSGNNNIAVGNYSSAIGNDVRAREDYESVFGYFGTDDYPAINTLASRLFNIGASQNGGSTRADAFSVFRNGKIWMPLLATGPGTKQLRIDASGNITKADTVITSNNYIVRGSGDNTGATSTFDVATYTTTYDAIFEISSNVIITAVTGGVVTTKVTYTDVSSASRTATFYDAGSTTAGLSVIGASSYSVIGGLQVKSGTTITVTQTLTVGTATWTGSATITEVRPIAM